MASALLASPNEPYWRDPKVYMRKNPNPNPNNLFPNPNPSFDHHASWDQFRSMELHEPSASAAAAAASDDSSYFNRKPTNAADLVTFNIESYSKKELRELKRRLMSELDRVRSVCSRIESREFQSSFRSEKREATSSTVLPSIHGSDGLVSRSMHKTNNETTERPVVAAAAPELKKLHTSMMKKCSQILTKLMKHKGAIWFNSPVDVVGMGLHDYQQIIKNPMDLGTAKSKLSKGFYHSPVEFASDIRLTFKNALVYNPEGHDVHRFADQLLKHFESMFDPAIAKYEKQRSTIVKEENDPDRRQMVSSWSQVQNPVQSKPLQSQLVQPKPILQQQPPLLQPPNLKVNDPNKRAMSLEEKTKLGSHIQNLPDEKMVEVLEFVSKRNKTLQNGDEVEVDFEVMDNETLCELDRFVSNWNKTVSKMKKRPELMANGGHNYQDPLSAVAAASHFPAPPLSLPSDIGNKSPILADETPETKKIRKGEPVDEEVDIGDETPAIHYPSVEIEKESSSSSSGSDSSSSSDSDSRSWSGSDSDDDGRSLPVGCRSSPRG